MDSGVTVQDLSYEALRQRLIADDALLDWPSNVMPLGGTAIVDFNDLPTLPAGMSGTTSGTSMTGQWSGTGTLSVVPGDLNVVTAGYYGQQSVATSPGMVQGNYDEARQNTRSLDGQMTGEVWVTFLANSPDATAQVGLSLNPTTNGDPNDGPIAHWVGLVGDQLTIAIDGTPTNSLASLPVGQDHLIVMRLAIDAQGDETVQLWADPTNATSLGTPLFESASVDMFNSLQTIGALSFNSAGPAFGANGGLLDSIRISNEPDAMLQALGLADSASWLPGDTNLDQQLTSADVDQFVAGWLKVNTEDAPHIRWQSGDLNLDGISDLRDAYLMHLALTNQGLPTAALKQLFQIPEPSSGQQALLFILAGAMIYLGTLRRNNIAGNHLDY